MALETKSAEGIEVPSADSFVSDAHRIQILAALESGSQASRGVDPSMATRSAAFDASPGP